MDNLTGDIFAFYLVATAWVTAKGRETELRMVARLVRSCRVGFSAVGIPHFLVYSSSPK